MVYDVPRPKRTHVECTPFLISWFYTWSHSIGINVTMKRRFLQDSIHGCITLYMIQLGINGLGVKKNWYIYTQDKARYTNAALVAYLIGRWFFTSFDLCRLKSFVMVIYWVATDFVIFPLVCLELFMYSVFMTLCSPLYRFSFVLFVSLPCKLFCCLYLTLWLYVFL